jgi:hypothetical protein
MALKVYMGSFSEYRFSAQAAQLTERLLVSSHVGQVRPCGPTARVTSFFFLIAYPDISGPNDVRFSLLIFRNRRESQVPNPQVNCARD